MRDVAANSSAKAGGAVGRRALIATGGLTAAGVVIAGTPLALKFGRRQLAIELANLEGIALDAATQAADVTYQAVNLIVMPIADALTGISAESLDNLSIAVEKLRDLAGTFGVDKTALTNLDEMLKAWKQNVVLFPATVEALNRSERDAGKKYLQSLKAKQKREAENL